MLFGLQTYFILLLTMSIHVANGWGNLQRDFVGLGGTNNFYFVDLGGGVLTEGD